MRYTIWMVVLTCCSSSAGLSQRVSLVQGSTEPRIQLTGENFQLFSNGTYYTSLVPGMTLSQYGVLGADLGYPVVYADKIVFLFGDTLSVYAAAGPKYFLSAGSGANDSIGYIPNLDLNQCHYIGTVDQQIAAGNTRPSVSPGACPGIRFYQNPKPGLTDHIFMSTTISGLQNGEDLGPFETPSGAFDYNGRLYMFYITNEQNATPHYALQSILAKADQSNTAWSDKAPPTFTRLYTVSSHPAITDPANPPSQANDFGKFMFNPPVALDAATLGQAGFTQGLPLPLRNAAKVVFVFGSSWRYNLSNLYLAAFSADDVEAGTSKWFYYAGQSGGVNNWTTDEKAAAPLLPEPANIGNHSIVWNAALHNFVLMSGNVVARFSPKPWGPWSDPISVFGPQSPWALKLIHHPGQDTITRSVVPIYNPQTNQVNDLNSTDTGVPYGPYIIDKFTQNTDGSVTVFYTMSTWNPYQVFLVSSTFQLNIGGGTIVNSADFDPGAIAAGSIATLFASGISTETFTASSTDLPTMVGGRAVTVEDSAGMIRPAGLYYAGPNQINFVIPSDSASGAATVTLTQGSTPLLSLTTQISKVAPALFTANGNGKGVASGFLLSVDSNGSVGTQPLFSCGSGSCGTNPIDLGSAQNGAYLELFGTGFRNVSSQTAVTATVGGIPAAVTYAGAQNAYPGMDQINIQVPLQLQGKGTADVIVTADGKTANTVQVAFK